MTEAEFKTCIAILQVGTGKTMTPEQRRVWFDCLNDLAAEQFAGAIQSYLREGDDWPSIAKLRRFAGVISGIDPEQRAERAYVAVRRAISTQGGYRSVSFDDPLTNAVVRSLGGWPYVCLTTEDDAKWLHRDFVRTYRNLFATGIDGDFCRPLPGLTEIENQATGESDFNEPAVVSVGLPGLPAGRISGPISEPKRLPGAVSGFLPHFGEFEIVPPAKKPDPAAPRDVDSEIEKLGAWAGGREA